jgi:hypothetical protein
MFWEGLVEWEKVCVESGLPPQKLKKPIKTRFASKVIMFEECFKFKKTIFVCYGKQKTMTLQQ